MAAVASFRREQRRGKPATVASSRQRIDAAALRLLAENGYDGLSLQAIADEVGLHKSTLFHHYRGKAELVEHVVEQVMVGLVERTQSRLEKRPPTLDDLVGLAEDLVDHFAKEPAAPKVLLHVLLSPKGSPLDLEMAAHPLGVLITTLVTWLDSARRCGVIRWVRIRHTLMDLIGMLVFHPAAAEKMTYLTGEEPLGGAEREKRKADVALFVRRALAPESDESPRKA